MLLNYLNRIAPYYVENHVFYRVHEGKTHGIDFSGNDTQISKVRMIIAPDSSSSEFDVHYDMYNHEIDVLVIDHHEADKVSEYACVINNQLCDYPTKSLSGVGMVYKFCKYIDTQLGQDIADDYLDLVALGLIGDMMDMRDIETHYLTMRGLQNLRNPFMKTMANIQEFMISKHGGLSPYTVAFYMVPFINAATRVGTIEEKFLVFNSLLEYKAYDQVPSTKRGCKGQVETIVAQACRTCINAIKNRQTKSQEASIDLIERLIVQENLLSHKILIVRLEKKYAIDTNLTGLVANKFASEYKRPTLILNQKRKVISEDSDSEYDVWEGSGRGVNESSFTDFRAFLDDSKYFYLAQGHANAFGAGICANNIEKFIEWSDKQLKDVEFSPSYKIDFCYEQNEILSEEILDLASYETLWNSQNIDEPLVCIENIPITKSNILLQGKDKNTIKITLPNGIEVIKFGASEEEFDNLYTEMGCVNIRVIGTCHRNIWNGKITPQIQIKDYEVIGKTAYYF